METLTAASAGTVKRTVIGGTWISLPSTTRVVLVFDGVLWVSRSPSMKSRQSFDDVSARASALRRTFNGTWRVVHAVGPPCLFAYWLATIVAENHAGNDRTSVGMITKIRTANGDPSGAASGSARDRKRAKSYASG